MSCGVGPAKITVRLNFSRLAVQPALLDYRELIRSRREIEDVSRLDLAARYLPANFVLEFLGFHCQGGRADYHSPNSLSA